MQDQATIIQTTIVAQERYPFQNKAQQTLFDILIHELRCQVCQNQILAESETIEAEQFKHGIYQLVKAGKPKTEILQFVQTHYGQALFLDPPFQKSTLLLWLGPWLLLILGVLIFLRQFKSRSTFNGSDSDELNERGD